MPVLFVTGYADGLCCHGPPLPHALPERLEDCKPYHVWIEFGDVLANESQLRALRDDVAADDELGIVLVVLVAPRRNASMRSPT
jgi:hypothetical protein